MGESRFTPGEWKVVNAMGDDIKKQVFPLPVRDPSSVLFNLLDLLLKSGKELASVAEIFVGKMPGQNTPATTTMATIEQGMKVFTAVYKRVYRSLQKEFRKLYKLNRTYLNPQQYIAILDMEVQQSDYESPEDDIIPGADPTAVSGQEKQAKVQALMQILQLGTLNPMAVTQLYLEAHEISQPEKYMMQPQPKTDPKVEAMQAKAELEKQKATRDIQMNEAKTQMELASKEQEMQMKSRAQAQDMQMKMIESILKAKQADEMHKASMQQQMQQSQLNMITSAQQAQQKNQQMQEASNTKQKLSKEKKVNANKPK
jgi:chaperonin GroES